jgi:hypothetical protein
VGSTISTGSSNVCNKPLLLLLLLPLVRPSMLAAALSQLLSTLLPSVLPVAADKLSLLLLLPLGLWLRLRPSHLRWGFITGSMMSGSVAFSMNRG